MSQRITSGFEEYVKSFNGRSKYTIRSLVKFWERLNRSEKFRWDELAKEYNKGRLSKLKLEAGIEYGDCDMCIHYSGQIQRISCGHVICPGCLTNTTECLLCNLMIEPE